MLSSTVVRSEENDNETPHRLKNQDPGQTIVRSSIADVEFGESAVTPVTLDT